MLKMIPRVVLKRQGKGSPADCMVRTIVRLELATVVIPVASMSTPTHPDLFECTERPQSDNKLCGLTHAQNPYNPYEVHQLWNVTRLGYMLTGFRLCLTDLVLCAMWSNPPTVPLGPFRCLLEIAEVHT